MGGGALLLCMYVYIYKEYLYILKRGTPVVVHEWHCQIVKQAAASQWRPANMQGGMMNDSNEWCATKLKGGM